MDAARCEELLRLLHKLLPVFGTAWFYDDLIIIYFHFAFLQNTMSAGGEGSIGQKWEQMGAIRNEKDL